MHKEIIKLDISLAIPATFLRSAIIFHESFSANYPTSIFHIPQNYPAYIGCLRSFAKSIKFVATNKILLYELMGEESGEGIVPHPEKETPIGNLEVDTV